MKKLFIYLYLQAKRTLRFFPFVLSVTLILAFSLALVVNVLLRFDTSVDKNEKISIGIVGDTSDSYLGFGITAIQSLDSSRYSMNLVELTEEEAKEKIKKGEIAAYLVIPEGFIDSVVSGNIKPIPYVTTSAAVDLPTLFKDEILSVIACMLVESQKGVYALKDSMQDHHLDNVYTEMDRLNVNYFSLILNRSSTFKTEIIEARESLSFGGEMICGITVFLILISGISCCSLFSKKDFSLPKLLNANGNSSFFQIVGEYIPYFILMYANFALLFMLLIPLAGEHLSGISELKNAQSVSWISSLLLRLFPIISMLTALQFLFYEITTNLVSAVLLQFLSTLALSYVSGCLYPIQFFPESIQKLANFLPTGIAHHHLSSFLMEETTVSALLPLLGYTLLFLSAAICIRKQRIVQA